MGPVGGAQAVVNSYASSMVSGILSQVSAAPDTQDEVTDISMSLDCSELKLKKSPPRSSSRSSQQTVESDSLEETPVTGKEPISSKDNNSSSGVSSLTLTNTLGKEGTTNSVSKQS